MDKISKLIRKIPKKEALKIADAIEKIINNQVKELDIKKLRGYDYIYRVRVGKYRIIYTNNKKEVRIVEISKRDDVTYKKY